MDFGIAKLLGVTGPTQTGTTLGTVSYMSPEQVAGKEADARADVWSLGAVLYEMLTGQKAFRGDHEWAVINAITNSTPEPLRSLRPEIPQGVESLVVEALEKLRDDRLSSASQFVKQANGCRAALADAPSGTELSNSIWQRMLRPAIVVPALLGAALVGAGGFWFSSQDADARRARDEIIPEILELVEQDDYAAAFVLAVEAERHIPNDPILADLWPQLSRTKSLDTTPDGADVSFKHYQQPDDDWIQLGVTPLQDVRLPLGLLRVRVEKPGLRGDRVCGGHGVGRELRVVKSATGRNWTR